MLENKNYCEIHHYACTDVETFLQDFLILQKLSLQIMMVVSEIIVWTFDVKISNCDLFKIVWP